MRLGPAFVKIGQALSSRPDVLPPAYIGALEALQDRIPPFPDAAAMAGEGRRAGGEEEEGRREGGGAGGGAGGGGDEGGSGGG